MTLDAAAIEPMITYGTNPGMAIPVTRPIPDPEMIQDPQQRQSMRKALDYMGLTPGRPIEGQPIDVVFIGSCTNARISDLRLAASILKGRKINPRLRVLVVPGSQEIKKREAGCSMCIAMNGDELKPGQYCVSTSNRNFEGRQGKGGRTFLASPLTAAASALTGVVTDARTMVAT